jgi:hypothetical protein
VRRKYGLESEMTIDLWGPATRKNNGISNFLKEAMRDAWASRLEAVEAAKQPQSARQASPSFPTNWKRPQTSAPHKSRLLPGRLVASLADSLKEASVSLAFRTKTRDRWA